MPYMKDSTGKRLDTFAVANAARPYNVAPGAKAVFLGDSITHRSSAAAGRGWVDQLPKILGTAVISANSLEKGVPGERSDQIAARYAADVRANGAQVLFVLAGTNDAAQNVPLATYAASIKSIVANARQDGIPVIVGTVPPRGVSAATTQTKLLTAQYNAWLKVWGPSNGVIIADVYRYLVNSFSEMIVTGYDSGDGTHPETLGHQKIAEAFADAYAGIGKANHLVDSPSSLNKVTTPTFIGNSATGWYEQPGGTGTAPVYSYAADTSGKLTAGQWRVIDFDCTAAGGNRYYCTQVTVTPGSKVLITARLDMTDVAGGFYNAANSANPSANLSLRLMDGSFVALQQLVTSAVRNPGPVCMTYTVPAGVSTLTLVLQMLLPTGQHAQFKIGEVGVFDLTSLDDIAAAV